jgi:hypothetical protein
MGGWVFGDLMFAFNEVAAGLDTKLVVVFERRALALLWRLGPLRLW